MRVARVREILPRIEYQLKELGNHTVLVSFKMGKFFIALLIFAHILACCWGALGDMDWDEGSELNPPWMQSARGEDGVIIADLSLLRRYAFAFSWSTAILLQGGGVPPISPGTLREVVFLVISNLFAFYVCALFVGSMVAMLESMYTSKQKLKTDKSMLEGFMIKRQIPSLLQARALEDLEGSYQTVLVPDESCDKVLDKLAPATRQKIREELYRTVVQRHPFFAQFPEDALQYLCGQVRVIHTQRGEYVVRCGQVASSMFFVVEGQYLAQRPADDPKQEDVHLTHQAFFGAQCIFKESVRTRNIIAVTNGELLEISTSDIYSVAERFSAVAEALQMRLQDAAHCEELCAYCGFAHRLSDCPWMSQLSENKEGNPPRQGRTRTTFKGASHAIVAARRLAPGNKTPGQKNPNVSPSSTLLSVPGVRKRAVSPSSRFSPRSPTAISPTARSPTAGSPTTTSEVPSDASKVTPKKTITPMPQPQSAAPREDGEAFVGLLSVVSAPAVTYAASATILEEF